MIQPPAASPGVTPSAFGTADYNVRSVRSAALFATIAGCIGLLTLSILFIAGAPLIGLIHGDRATARGWPMVILLLASAGGYGMLAFYGMRLLRYWMRRHRLSLTPLYQRPGEIAVSDLHKIRWISCTTMLAIVAFYLIPANSPVLFEASKNWNLFGSPPAVRSSWWYTPSAMTTLVIAWAVCASMLVLAARRAAWDVAAAQGHLAGPEESPAFQVVTATPQSQFPPPLPAATAVNPEGLTSTPFATAIVSPIPTAAPALGLVSGNRASRDFDGHREWESVMTVLLILVLLICIGVCDTTRPLRDVLASPGQLGKELKRSYDVAANAGLWDGSRSSPSTVRGVAASLVYLSNLLLSIIGIVGILWVLMCYLMGLRLRRTAILFTWIVLGSTLYCTFAVDVLYGVRYSGINVRGDMYVSVNHFSWLQGAILPIVLLVVLTRAPVRALFDIRVRKSAGLT